MIDKARIHDLAESALADREPPPTRPVIDHLAKIIEETIEDFFDFLDDKAERSEREDE